MARYCPDCGELIGGRSSCSCGWKEETKPIGRSGGGQSGRIPCNGIGCPLPGTITESIAHKSAHDATWYCRFHFSVRSDPHLHMAISEDLRKNGDPLRRKV